MSPCQDVVIPVLFRYFMAASLMRQDFERYISDSASDSSLQDGLVFLATKAGLTMCLWYGMLFVVIEGWQEAALSDPEIDHLLQSPNVDLLRRFRNGIFHFQQHWLDPRLTDFCGTPDGVHWVRMLTSAFRCYFLKEMRRINGFSCE